MLRFQVTLILIFAVFFTVQAGQNFDEIQLPNFKKKLKCDYSDNNDAVLAIRAAKTQECREKMETAACHYKELFATTDRLEIPRLDVTCPFLSRDNISLVCRIHALELSKQINKSDIKHTIFAPSPTVDLQFCRDMCLSSHGTPYMAYSILNICMCLHSLSKKMLERNALYKRNHICSAEMDHATFEVFTTGYFEANNDTKPYEPSPTRLESIKSYQELKKSLNASSEVQGTETRKFHRIVFFFTVYQRTYRHIVRLFKALYDESHFYYFHIDARSKYLRVKMTEFLAKLKRMNVENVKITDWAMAPIWAGSSLLEVHLRAMRELMRYKNTGEWNWDYLMNLSESDYPVKTIEEMVLYLSEFNEGQSFLSLEINQHSTKNTTDGYGLNRFFLECEERMWLVAERRMPIGHRIDCGAEWFWFHSSYVDYLANTKDDFVIKLREYYKYAAMAPESFYHSVMLSSHFCTNYIGRNLIKISFGDREEDCQCHGKVVDWCGCSPAYYRFEKWPELEQTFHEPILMARKFDPRQGLKIINKLDQAVFGNYSSDFKSLDSFWLNTYQNGIDKLYYADVNQRNLFDRYFNHALNFMQKSTNITINQDSKPSLNQVHSFFKDEIFKGFLLNFNLSLTENGEKKIVDFEVYLKSRTNDHIKSTINHNSNPRYDRMGYYNSTSSPKLHYDTFFKYFTDIEVSTDFERRERRATNYAGLIDRKSHPFVILNFEGKIWSEIKFKIHWIDPKGKLAKTNSSIISTPLKKNYTYFQDHLLPEKALANLLAGVWHVRVVAESFNNLTRQTTEQVLLIEEFLVTPTYEELTDNVNTLAEDQYRSLLNEFWSLESICVANRDPSIRNKAVRRMNRCEVDSEWSSFFPDPKSEINDGPISHNRLRDYAEYQARFDQTTSQSSQAA